MTNKTNTRIPREITETGFVHLSITLVQQVSESVIMKSGGFRPQCITSVLVS